MKLFTIGHTKKNLESFVRLLRDAGVDAIIDIRLNNTSQLAGFAKKDDLSFISEEFLAISYLHVPELAPTDEMLDDYRSSKDWEAYESKFLQLMQERNAAAVAAEVLAPYERPCLLCSEDTPEHCHRRLVAELIAARTDVEVIHLH